MSEYPMDPQARLEIARGLLGAIDERGYCRCPGAELHTNRSGPQRPDRPGRDCRVYLAPSAENPRGVPSIKCVHSSCEGVVAEANHRLRSEIAKHEGRLASQAGYRYEAPKQRKRSREELAAEAEGKRLEALRERSRLALPRILEEWTWEQYDMWEASATLPAAPLEQARAMLRLFEPGDVVWCGGFKESIAPEDVERAGPGRVHRVRSCFRTAREWLRETDLPGPRICPNAMKAGVLSRSDASVQARRFLVVEHDLLPLPAQGSVLRWLNEKGGLRLRAVVFTGGKSLHGWFDCPPGGQLKEMETVLGGMGYDPASFRPHQPFRLPGWPHDKTGEMAALWYLAPEGEKSGRQEGEKGDVAGSQETKKPREGGSLCKDEGRVG